MQRKKFDWLTFAAVVVLLSTLFVITGEGFFKAASFGEFMNATTGIGLPLWGGILVAVGIWALVYGPFLLTHYTKMRWVWQYSGFIARCVTWNSEPSVARIDAYLSKE